MPEKSKNNTAFNADQSERCLFAAAAVFYNLLSDMYYLCILTKKPPCILLAYSICMYSSMKYQICTVTIFHLLSTTYAGFLLSSTKKGIIKFNAEKFKENSRITGGNTILLLLPLHTLSKLRQSCGKMECSDQRKSKCFSHTIIVLFFI